MEKLSTIAMALSVISSLTFACCVGGALAIGVSKILNISLLSLTFYSFSAAIGSIIVSILVNGLADFLDERRSKW